MFGKNDPWCKPCFAKKMLQRLSRRASSTTQRYIELDQVGHCPNHEAPQAVGHAVRSWVDASIRSRGNLQLFDGHSQVFSEAWADFTIQELDHDNILMNMLDHRYTALI